jgi:hypothetical protein
VRACDVALFVDLLLVEPAGTPNTGDLSDSDAKHGDHRL